MALPNFYMNKMNKQTREKKIHNDESFMSFMFEIKEETKNIDI